VGRLLKYRVLLWLLTSLGAAQAFSAEDRPILTACGHHDYAPWNWLQGDRIVGVCAEAAQQLFGTLGFDVDLTYVGPWKRCQQMVSSGEVDLNICSFKNPERETYSHFSNTPMASNENALFVNKAGGLEYEKPASLDGKLIGLVRGVSLGGFFDHYLLENSHVIRGENYYRLFSMLFLERIDGVIIGRQSGQHLLNLYDLDEHIVDSPIPLVEGDLYFSISKKSPHYQTLSSVEDLLNTPDYQLWLQRALKRYSKMHKAYIEEN
jgi:polar amino acid transport system substrate-binding protein